MHPGDHRRDAGGQKGAARRHRRRARQRPGLAGAAARFAEPRSGLAPAPAAAKPALAKAEGALGFWKALGELWPTTREQHCWAHKTANILNKLPKSQQPKATRSLQESGWPRRARM